MVAQGKSYDVVVSGAGMVGAATACLLTKQGMRVALVDSQPLAQWHQTHFSPRVSAVNLASMRVFRWLETWDEIQHRRISPYSRMQVWENDSSAAISFNAMEMGQPQLGYIIENSAIVSALVDKLRQNYNVDIFEQTALQSRSEHIDCLELQLDNGQSIECRLLVGADGANSHTRQISGIDTSFSDYGQDAIVTTVTISGDHQKTAWQCFLATGPVAMLPLSDGRCSIVWTCDREFCLQVMDLDDEEFCLRLSQYFEHQLGKVVGCDKRVSFPLRQHHASTYLSRRTVLVGDAAHITHPLAGLGANIGFMDAAALSQVLDAANSNNRDFASRSVLRRYERWRKGENALVLATMKGFKSVFGSDIAAVRSARAIGLSLADSIEPVKQQFARYAMGLAGDLAQICRN